jgi:hypothetical protein
MVRKKQAKQKNKKIAKASPEKTGSKFRKDFWKNRQNSGSNFGKSLERQKTAKMGYPIRTFRT